MPTISPSSLANFRAHSNASSLVTVTTSSDQRRIEVLGNEPGADALNLVRARLAAADDRRMHRLDGDGLERGVAACE